MQYRKEIDGLRAFAILPVLAYHMNSPILTGGFLGVDVFFVISGYLISRIISDQIKAANFSYIRFYENRILRLGPAIIAVFIFTLIGAVSLYSPDELNAFSAALLSSVLFISNIYFSFQDGYTAAGSHQEVLLHTWSLANEEQFYIFAPLVASVLLKFGFRLRFSALLVFFFISLSVALYFQSKNPISTFFLLHFRAWELLAGVMAASVSVRLTEKHMHPEWAMGACMAALVLMVGCMQLVSDDVAHPGPVTVIIVLSTAALLILSPYSLLFKSFLSWSGFVFVGLISYSLYVWHWPIIVLANQFFPPSDFYGPVALIFIVFLVSYGSYRFLEKPIRYGQGWAALAGKRTRAIATSAAYFAFLIVSVLLFFFNSSVYRAVNSGQPLGLALASPASQAVRDVRDSAGRCYNRNLDNVCRFTQPGSDTLFIAAGDSYMDMQTFRIRTLATEFGADLYIDAISGCPLITGMTITNQPDRLQEVMRRCNNINPERISAYRAWAEDYEQVVVFWALGGHYEIHSSNYSYQSGTLSQALADTFAELSEIPNFHVLAFEPFPNPPFHIANHVQQLVNEGTYSSLDEFRIETPRDVALSPMEETRALLSSLHMSSVTVVPTVETFCNEERCEFNDDLALLVYDRGHATRAGIEKLYSDQEQLISSILSSRQ